MGQLILPPSQYVYVDANTAIYSVEKIEPYCVPSYSHYGMPHNREIFW